MPDTDLIMYEEEFARVDEELQRLRRQTNAKVVFLVDKNGQLIASAGETLKVDTTSLASLTAGNIAATSGIAKLLGESEFTILFHEGANDNINISLVGDRVILVVIFDSRTSIGLVRLRTRKATESLAKVFEDLSGKAERQKIETSHTGSPFADISEEDIEKLFG